MTKPRQPLDMADADLYDGNPEGFDIYSWSPTDAAAIELGKPQAPCTQVHMYFQHPLGKGLFRFKGPNTLDRFIAALIKHRADVWGVPQDPNVWKSE